MPVVPRIPENAPFTAQQRAWLDGYLAGLLYDAVGTTASGSAPAAAAASAPRTPLLVAFGSQTGSAGSLAKSLAREADRRGFQSMVKELNQVSPADLASAGQCVIVTSTWGDGDPPDNATGFWSALAAEGAPRLESLRYAVLGLGDRNYADFCGAAKKFDLRLEQLGAQRVLARAECDVDFQATAKAWMEGLWLVLTSTTPAVATTAPAPETSPAPALVSPSQPAAYSRTRPFPGRLKVNRRLNRDGSDKDTRHLEIALEGSGLSYEAGDALGVVPENDPQLVAALTGRLGASGDEVIALPDGGSVAFREVLRRQVVITSVSDSLIREAAVRGANAELTGLLQPERKAELDQWKYGRDLLDLLELCPGANFAPAELTGMLRRLQPRLYSISSSPKAHPGEVHLTVAVVRYGAHGRQRSGVCSGFLADRVSILETPVQVFVQTSHGFRLPADGAVPIILIGPGTGIAPFRAFLEERRATGAKGPNWLFFGDQRRTVDFLYEEEVVPMHQDGFLTRLDLAFSRDQTEKIYVQHRMLEHAAELWRWLEAGAHVYVCGDAKRMAKDVDTALHRAIQTAGGRSPEQAAEYVAAMKSAKRYQRDVY